MPSLKVIKKFLRKHHKQVPQTSDPAFGSGFERKWESLRRNAIDFGPRPRHNGTPLCLILDEDATLPGIKGENNRLKELDERVYWGDDEKIVRRKTGAYRYPSRLDGVLHDTVLEDPFQQDIKTFGDILAFMHSQHINVAGYPKTEREKLDCGNGRCRCLGPMIRDV